MNLPRLHSKEDYSRVYARTPLWLPAMREICARHGLDASSLRREVLGTHLVFRAGGYVLKLFCPLFPEDHHAERVALEHLRGLPTPEIVAEGRLEDWPYVVMTRVPGRPAADVWDDLDPTSKTDVVEQLGDLMRELHQHTPPRELATDWSAFLRKRIAQCDAHHAAEEPWRSWIRRRVDGFTEPPFDPVLLSADITSDHLLLQEQGERWHISGFIDFGDAMLGHPHYEFIAPLMCYTLGEPQLSRTLVASYGLKLTPLLADRLTTYCLLHKFGRLRDFLSRFPVTRPNDLPAALWGESV